ncbi:MAG: ABC transporter ATP-binding protein [Chloroflexi bacterium]|nr:ABC transporter ATP-binding protein [Chloroflexota bacterium]
MSGNDVHVNSALEAANMLVHRWPVIVAATFSIVLFTGAILLRPIVIQRAIDDGLIGGDRQTLLIATIVFGALALSVYVFQAASTYTTAWLGQRFMRDLRVRLFSHYQRLSMSFFDRENSGRLVSRMTADMNALTDVLNNGFLIVIQSALILLGTVIIMFALSWQLSLVTLVIFPPLLIGTAMFRIYSARAYEVVRDRIADVLIHMQETFAGMRVVKAYGREPYNMERFGAINEDNFEANIRTVRISSMYIPLIEWLGGFGIGIILYFGGRWVIGDAVTVGTVAAFIFYLDFIFQPIQRLSQVYDMLQSALAALNKIFSLLAVEPELRDPERPLDLAGPRRGAIEFDRVTFGYDPGRPVLHEVSFQIEPGQRVALVGATGAGKSTIAKLALRFYDPTSGRILLDSRDLRDLRFADLRSVVTLVPQEGFLFSGTIRENILFGRPDASEEDVIRSCRVLGIHEFIQALPDGYDTAVSYRGSRLSAGEKQLVSLARAFLADPPVLILDEATSSLDPHTEALVEDAMARLYADRTTIVVAHRLSTAEHADRVLVIDDGRLVEDGHHRELVRREGAYAALYGKWAPEPASSDVA